MQRGRCGVWAAHLWVLSLYMQCAAQWHVYAAHGQRPLLCQRAHGMVVGCRSAEIGQKRRQRAAGDSVGGAGTVYGRRKRR